MTEPLLGGVQLDRRNAERIASVSVRTIRNSAALRPTWKGAHRASCVPFEAAGIRKSRPGAWLVGSAWRIPWDLVANPLGAARVNNQKDQETSRSLHGPPATLEFVSRQQERLLAEVVALRGELGVQSAV